MERRNTFYERIKSEEFQILLLPIFTFDVTPLLLLVDTSPVVSPIFHI